MEGFVATNKKVDWDVFIYIIAQLHQLFLFSYFLVKHDKIFSNVVLIDLHLPLILLLTKSGTGLTEQIKKMATTNYQQAKTELKEFAKSIKASCK